MNADGKSDGFVVPPTRMNNAGAEPSAESAEGREPTKKNAGQADSPRAPKRKRGRSYGLAGVRETARSQPELKFTSLLHHVNENLLTEAFFDLKKTAAVGVDVVTWHDYEQGLEDRIADLHGRVHRGSYRAKPSKRIYITKADGRERPIGIASLEDKVVQKAVGWVLQCIYEQDFLGFSYGFRPGRSQHKALDALSVALTSKKVNWVLDADVKGFFDNMNHDWLMKFLEHRIADKRVLRLIGKWLRAGVSDDGEWTETKVGTPQGAVISPLLANIYLHYVLDLWIQSWRNRRGRGDMVIIRFADDFVVGFQHKYEAEAFLEELRERFAKFSLELHGQKTRLIEFGRFAMSNRKERGEGRPETFDFLGFTHRCDVTRSHGWFTIRRETIAKRMRATLAAIKAKLRQRRHWPVGVVGRWLARVMRGWLNYHAVPGNMVRLQQFRNEVAKLWLAVLRRRSQRSTWTWTRMQRLARKHLPTPRILHSYPQQNFHARFDVGAG
ncbi:group II intron reverse transcriptase/maturase [Crateriforma conspicua]|uniref:Group II intron-encoded protein LtrA n=1 Tax=Crateriforma conspicua TaxID=2527996 RepID=A0A5C5Y4C1_9PLAN|nr:group II intron reverse transcriptase/maturase [Crateriforma conspicua]TWT68232.1 Group II intron-encoded protein LtrA [Crateriforma conspicua]